jgi:hypothetical protein
VSLELHGMDVLDVTDGLEALRGHQPDVTVPRGRKEAALAAAFDELAAAGYSFVTCAAAADTIRA